MSDESPSSPERVSSRRSGRRRRAGRRSGGWGQRLLVLGGCLMVLAVVAYFGFGIWLKNFLRSEGFHNQLSDRLGEKIKARSEFEGLAWNDSSVQLAKLTATGYSDAQFTKATVEDVRADVRLSLWERTVDIPLVTISRVNLDVSEQGKLPQPYTKLESAGSPGGGRGSWLDNFKPDKLTLQETQIDEFSATVKSSAGEIRVASLPLVLKNGQTFDTWNIESHPQSDRAVLATNLGGGLRMKFKDLRARVRPEQFDLIQLEGTLERMPAGKRTDELSPTLLSLNGHYRPTIPAAADFELHLTDLNLEDWVEPDWVKRLSGRGELKAHLTGDPNRVDALRLEGEFSIKNGVLTSLPLLENLAERTKTKEFTRLELNTAKWHFDHLGDVWQLDKIEIAAKGLMRLEGFITITGNTIQGVLEVGVEPGRLKAIDGAEQRVFTREDKGYKWAKPAMRLSGTLDNIKEDLGTRIKDAWLDQQIENVTELAAKAPEALLNNGGKAVELGTQVLEQGTKAAPDVINTGVKLLQGLFPGGR